MPLKLIARISKIFKDRRVYIGRAPAAVPARSLIVFPVLPFILPCGLAGIVTVKKATQASPLPDPLTALDAGFRKIAGRGLRSLLAGEAEAADYLGGTEPLALLDAMVLSLKESEPFLRLLAAPGQTARLTADVAAWRRFAAGEEQLLEENALRFSTAELEILNSRQVFLKDIVWALEKDILANIDRIEQLAGNPEATPPPAWQKYLKLNFLLNALDRLEVRGRDSAGIQIRMTIDAPETWNEALARMRELGLYDDFLARSGAGDFVNGAIHCSRGDRDLPERRQEPPAPSGESGAAAAAEPPIPGAAARSLSFVYKTASIIGTLGRNVRELRQIISRDRILQLLAGLDTSCDVALAHTRWASVGSITAENCHPVNNFTRRDLPGSSQSPGTEKYFPAYGRGNWSISVVLNGDIDNYRSLRNALEADGELIAPEITTDTKIIPLEIEKHLRAGCDAAEAFRRAVNAFEGSHAIAMITDVEPGKAFLALRGSGQSIYVGLAGDRYLFSSELYGLVEGTPHFLKMDGETAAAGGSGVTGQIFILGADPAGGPAGIRACAYDGTPLTVTPELVQRAEITTRDIDRGEYSHYFLKEINEAGASVRKTIRGKYRLREGADGHREVRFNLGYDIVPEPVRHALTTGTIKQLIVIGHGTAAVAGQAIADAFTRYLRQGTLRVTSRIASELSGFDLAERLSDTLIIPVTQSGTTTDTNRAVAMAAERGAWIIAVVNRRQSDITAKSHGVFYTSDGRDIEMAVASTKAFYSQIVAGHILALYTAQLLKTMSDEDIAAELEVIARAPEMMGRVMERQDELRRAAERLAGRKKYWAVVGSGPNKAAADEIRIKLSELCYKTISSDIVENKKHIDLSAEPLIIVCAAGSPPAVVGDIVKDVAIFRAHKAGIIVFADEGEERFDEFADAVIAVPRAPLPLPVILNTMAGHLWGYYAAGSIDAEAAYLREFRSRMNQAMIEQGKRSFSLYDRLFDRQFRRLIGDFAAGFQERLLQGCFSQVNVPTVANIVLLLKYAMGKLPLEDFWMDFKGEEEFTSPLDLLDVSLGHAIDELSRPIDAIRHQAKTVTVGTSRREETISGPIFQLLRELGFSTRSLAGKNIMALKSLQPAVASIRGYTLYRLADLDAEGHPAENTVIEILRREGVAARMTSRVTGSKKLMGTKRTIVSTGHVYIGFGKADGATMVVIPLLGNDFQVEKLLLLHIAYRQDLTVPEKKAVLGYRYNDIRNLVNEYNLTWSDACLDSFTMEALLGEPVEFIADLIRKKMEVPP